MVKKNGDKAMHEGDHGIIDDAQRELDSKFGSSAQRTAHIHPHSHEKKKSGMNESAVKIVATIVVVILIGVFIFFRVL